MGKSAIWQEVKNHIKHHDRILFSCCGNETGPLVIFSAGIHGNEPSGVLALRNVCNHIVTENTKINGSLLAFIGNRTALNNNQRFSVVDLNRLWTDANLEKLHKDGFEDNELNPDILEMVNIDALINDFIKTASGIEPYFIDLHTTSAPSIPFAIADQKDHRLNIAHKFPMPVIVNANDYIQGTLLNYFETRSFHGLIFEAGQHFDLMSVKKHEAIIWLTLVECGVLHKNDVPLYNAHYQLLNGISNETSQCFKIVYRQALKPTDIFLMQEGYVNFQQIEKGEFIARLNGKKIFAPYPGRIFMPLYQSRGEDGFFIIKLVE